MSLKKQNLHISVRSYQKFQKYDSENEFTLPKNTCNESFKYNFRDGQLQPMQEKVQWEYFIISESQQRVAGAYDCERKTEGDPDHHPFSVRENIRLKIIASFLFLQEG